MLKMFSVENFMNFKEKVVLDLENSNSYQFNKSIIKNNIVKNALIYGKNATGKSNMGLAIFDIVFHLTDSDKNNIGIYHNYLNLDSDKDFATFSYEFKFGDDILIYNYKKSDISKIIYEEIIFNQQQIIQYDFNKPKEKIIKIDEAQTLNWKYNDNDISIIKYIVNNTKLKDNNPLSKLMDFVNGMLWFRNVEVNSFMGYLKNGKKNLSDIVLENNKLKDFQSFLSKNGIEYDLFELNETNGRRIGVRFKNGKATLDSLISTGTKALWLFYCWKIHFNQLKFVFIDEFDANYHFELSADIVRLLNSFNDLQSIVTTHNTSLLSNSLTRPDCAFIINNNCVTCLSKCTDKELREAHNIEKLFREGHFTD